MGHLSCPKPCSTSYAKSVPQLQHPKTLRAAWSTLGKHHHSYVEMKSNSNHDAVFCTSLFGTCIAMYGMEILSAILKLEHNQPCWHEVNTGSSLLLLLLLIIMRWPLRDETEFKKRILPLNENTTLCYPVTNGKDLFQNAHAHREKREIAPATFPVICSPRVSSLSWSHSGNVWVFMGRFQHGDHVIYKCVWIHCTGKFGDVSLGGLLRCGGIRPWKRT